MSTPTPYLLSLIRFRLRSLRFAPFFLLHANRAIAQIRKSDGFIAGALQRDAQLGFWTMTLWQSEQAMRAYAASGAHRTAMPHLADWADEASIGHWHQPGTTLPDWPTAMQRLRTQGRALTLRHPALTGENSGDTKITHRMRL